MCVYLHACMFVYSLAVHYGKAGANCKCISKYEIWSPVTLQRHFWKSHSYGHCVPVTDHMIETENHQPGMHFPVTLLVWTYHIIFMNMYVPFGVIYFLCSLFYCISKFFSGTTIGNFSVLMGGVVGNANILYSFIRNVFWSLGSGMYL